MYYIVDIPTCNRLGLQGAEVLVFSCLAYLCRDKGYWNGSYSKLAEYSLCGCDDTAKNCCARLIKKGLLSRENMRFSISTNSLPFEGRVGDGSVPKNSGDIPKISGDIPKISGFSEKESTKEKEIIKEKRGSNNIEPSPDDFLGSFYSPCTKVEAASFGQQNGIPVEVVGKWWYHFDERGWQNSDGTKIRNWQSSLQKWFLREKQMNMLFITGCPSASTPPCPMRERGLGLGSVDRNEQIRQAMLQQQHEEREKAEQDAAPMPESLQRRFAAFGKT